MCRNVPPTHPRTDSGFSSSALLHRGGEQADQSALRRMCWGLVVSWVGAQAVLLQNRWPRSFIEACCGRRDVRVTARGGFREAAGERQSAAGLIELLLALRARCPLKGRIQVTVGFEEANPAPEGAHPPARRPEADCQALRLGVRRACRGAARTDRGLTGTSVSSCASPRLQRRLTAPPRRLSFPPSSFGENFFG
ncbi:unnamed protein product [Rangifer tarandus platyrhynchus]|uniref:Uncharacterized protein n=1 Tax=Rangifer tarandus platyrhynchus TaxID=3082113 RepID=A0ABN8XZV3_RANTA|nr:unnamed protein product [Rangifer tarandus platyrhynchus]